MRVVRTPAGAVEVDLTGKANGRGAYLCRNAACWDSALRRDRLSTALKVKVNAEARAKLTVFAATLKEMAPA